MFYFVKIDICLNAFYDWNKVHEFEMIHKQMNVCFNKFRTEISDFIRIVLIQLTLLFLQYYFKIALCIVFVNQVKTKLRQIAVEKNFTSYLNC